MRNKRAIKRITLIVVLVLLVSVSILVYQNINGVVDYKRNVSKLNKVSIDKLLEMDKRDESFVLYIGRETCPGCVQFSETLSKALELKKTTVYYLDTEKKDKKISDFRERYDVEFVPSFIYFEEGEKYRKMETDISVEKLKEILDSIEG